MISWIKKLFRTYQTTFDDVALILDDHNPPRVMTTSILNYLETRILKEGSYNVVTDLKKCMGTWEIPSGFFQESVMQTMYTNEKEWIESYIDFKMELNGTSREEITSKPFSNHVIGWSFDAIYAAYAFNSIFLDLIVWLPEKIIINETS